MNIQIDGEVREATEDEVSNLEKQREDIQKAIKSFDEKQTKKIAVIEKLGLTADEAAALLG